MAFYEEIRIHNNRRTARNGPVGRRSSRQLSPHSQRCSYTTINQHKLLLHNRWQLHELPLPLQ